MATMISCSSSSSKKSEKRKLVAYCNGGTPEARLCLTWAFERLAKQFGTPRGIVTSFYGSSPMYPASGPAPSTAARHHGP